MEGYELESLEDRSDIIVNNDVLENSVEITSNNNFVEISVDKSVEHGEVPVKNNEENNVTRLEISVPVKNRENNEVRLKEVYIYQYNCYTTLKSNILRNCILKIYYNGALCNLAIYVLILGFKTFS